MKKSSINLGLLSKYRTECMGLAILFVLAVHSLDFGVAYPGPIAKVFSLGQIGVNIFFLLSGLGMYYALKKKQSIGSFYSRRFQKILPSYLIIAIPIFLIVDVFLDKSGFGIYFLDLSTLRYWLHGIGFWYFAVQIVLYLLIPLHHILHNKAEKYGWVVNLLAVIIVGMALGQLLKQNNIPTLGQLFERYAVFISGYWLAVAVEKNSKFPLIGGVLRYCQ